MPPQRSHSDRPRPRRAYSPLTPRRRPAEKASGGRATRRATAGARRYPKERDGGRRRVSKKEENGVPIPDVAERTIRIIPLGGVEEIGRNMTIIEDEHDIMVVDCGFQFKEEDTPGIDYILPNTKYLEERKEKVRAIVVTHGHLDHIGGIPYIVDKIGNPPIYSRRLTTVMIKKRQEEFPHLPALDIREVEKNSRLKIGKNMTLEFFSVTHTIPDSMGIIVGTPEGDIVHTGDLKLDHVNGVPTKAEEEEFKKFEKRNVLLLMADSTNVERPGFSIPESTVFQNLEDIIKTTHGRLIVGTFASQLERIVKIVEIAERHKRKVVVEGRSMKTNIDIIKELGILKARPGTFISLEEAAGLQPHQVLVLATGAQGDEFAALMRTAIKTHKHLKIQKGDTIVLSSSVIPGNERAVQKLKDNLSRQGARIIHYQVSDIHSSGHANREETAWIHKKIGARFFMPLHGYHYMLRVHADLAHSIGMPENHIIIPDNGSVIEVVEGGKRIVLRKEKTATGLRMVDGFSIGDIQEVVIRDRKLLAEDGMFVIIATINLKTGKLRKSPDIISRGFVYLRESQALLSETRLLTKKAIEDRTRDMNPINFDYLRNQVTDDVSRFLFGKSGKRPIVIPVLLGV